MNTLIQLSHQSATMLHASVAALVMFGLGLEGMGANYDEPLYSKT
jgi:hypothetical protein